MSRDPKEADQTVASPAASGPAGAHFEAQVGAHYLLTMLSEADPRGLPGTFIKSIELQRANEGHPLDDIIVRGTTTTGEPTVLEVQAKRTITFTPSDQVFKDVVSQLAKAFRTLDLSNLRHQFAVATSRTSSKITGPYQDVLRWAREVESASTFIGRINGKNVGNDSMRTFVATLRSNLAASGCSNDDQTVWEVLRRFHILPFDYDAPGSHSHELALERTRNLLVSDEAARANAFWKALIETALRSAADGGSLDRSRLLEILVEVDKFRFVGSPRNSVPREALADAALLAAADLKRTVAGVTLARTRRLEAIRAARDVGGYVEILGGPGVGKSGLLGMLVQEVLTEARALVLTPDRTIPGGWLQFNNALDVKVSPRTFLADLASDGGAVLFVDSLDLFDDHGKRATVRDLVRTAAGVPGFQVIVTARINFEKDEPNWLPSEALDRLGRAPPVIIEELDPEEISELSAAAPELRALLADEHPARDIVRNLFHLSRMLEVQGSAEDLRSEVDLLVRWWTTADGPLEGRRERARLLSDLSDAALAGTDHLNVRFNPVAVEQLLARGSLRELKRDLFVFRHDVLREWGLAALLHEDSNKLDDLPQVRPATASLARGVELAARLALERSSNAQLWVNQIDKVSREGSHPSWRRFSLLAAVRSELAPALLDRAACSLFAEDGALLRELIRTTIAVESRPLADTLAGFGVDKSLIPEGIFGPSNTSWAKLAKWLLSRRKDLPLQTLPDVVELFQSLSASMFFADPLTPFLANALADWLEEIELARDHHELSEHKPRFLAAYPWSELQKLAENVRTAFALMAERAPERAQAYLCSVLAQRNPHNAIRSLMKFRGSFAKAAPAEMARLTFEGLAAKREQSEPRQSSFRCEIFTHLDTEFLPSSPSQGPFLELLNAAPEHGLSLVRRLVDHAVTILFAGRDPGDDGLSIVLPSGPRFFPWLSTYRWSRDAMGCYAIESALMALEAWAHHRVERGDPLDQIIADILGPEGSPATYVLVAVDVLISHWPATRAAISPFLGAPELLSLDRTRQTYDSMAKVDLLGMGTAWPRKERGPVTLASLKERSSRRVSLETLLPHFTHMNGNGQDGPWHLLASAAQRLGAPEPDDTFAEPRFMARYALNLLEPSNWQASEGGRIYISPPEEALHIANLQTQLVQHTHLINVEAGIQNALENGDSLNPQFLREIIAYAKTLDESTSPQAVLGSRRETIVSVAMILARDGSDDSLENYESWVRSVFAHTFESVESDIARTMREGLRFNPIAIAALGMIHLWRRRRLDTDRDMLLELAGRNEPEAAQGFGAGVEIICKADPRLISSILRCALAAQIKPSLRWNDSEVKKADSKIRYRERVVAQINAERAWLTGTASEPPWPQLPPPRLTIKETTRIMSSGSRAQWPITAPENEDEFYAQSAALWLRQLTRNSNKSKIGWLPTAVKAYAGWTARANGSGFEPSLEFDSRLDEWNHIFFRMLAYRLRDLDITEASAELAHAMDIPDRSFFGMAATLVYALDELYFSDLGLAEEKAVQLRGKVIDRLVLCLGWRRECQRTELRVQTSIGPVIGALFFNDYNTFSGARCYLRPKGLDKVEPFFLHLTRLIQEGPVPFTALLTMNLLEVASNPAHVSFFLSSALTWLKRQPSDTGLWADQGLGARLARWLEAVFLSDTSLCEPSHPLRTQMNEILARLIQLGVPEAHRVENLLMSVTTKVSH